MLVSYLIVITKVLKIIYMLLPPLLRIPNILNTLNSLSTVATPFIPTLRSITVSIEPRRDPIAMMQSNMFHSS